jgi:3-phenylpropionate/trans-cinnamate dioxygenase ferredoxin subunit
VKEKEFTWHKIADNINEISFGENHIAEIEVKGKKICVAKIKDHLFAFAHKCPHAGGWLTDGFLDAQGNVVCPIHRYKYDLRNGRNVSGEGYYLKNWSIETRPDGIFVAMESHSGFWNLF